MYTESAYFPLSSENKKKTLWVFGTSKKHAYLNAFQTLYGWFLPENWALPKKDQQITRIGFSNIDTYTVGGFMLFDDIGIKDKLNVLFLENYTLYMISTYNVPTNSWFCHWLFGPLRHSFCLGHRHVCRIITKRKTKYIQLYATKYHKTSTQNTSRARTHTQSTRHI